MAEGGTHIPFVKFYSSSYCGGSEESVDTLVLMTLVCKGTFLRARLILRRWTRGAAAGFGLRFASSSWLVHGVGRARCLAVEMRWWV